MILFVHIISFDWSFPPSPYLSTIKKVDLNFFKVSEASYNDFVEDYGDDPFEAISDEDFFEGESPVSENNNFRFRKRVGSPHPSNLSGSSGGGRGRYRILPHISQPERTIRYC